MQGVQRMTVLVVNYFVLLNFNLFVVVIFDLVREVEAKHGLC